MSCVFLWRTTYSCLSFTHINTYYCMKKYDPNVAWASMLAKYLIRQIQERGLEKYKITSDSMATILLSWAPWSWKTEFAQTIENLQNYIIIDIDQYRNFFRGYSHANAWKYQDCCSRVATKIFKFCITNELKVIFDGTLTSDISLQNISHALRKKRSIGIVLMYQDPHLSYLYTKIRMEKNERNVGIDTFIKIYFNSIEFTFQALEKCPSVHFIIASKEQDSTWNINDNIRDRDTFDNRYHIHYNESRLRVSLLNNIPWTNNS